jgi:hypothetical protein
MITIDNLLLLIINHPGDYAKNNLSKKDFDVLQNLSGSVSSHFFITENQGRLLVRILKENQKSLHEFADQISEALVEPRWSKKFRQIEQVKKLYIANNEYGDSALAIEFTFSSQLRKVIQDLVKILDNVILSSNGKVYHVDLTEKNIVTVVDTLAPLKFEIDETVQNHYDTIKSWSEDTVRNQFLITNIEHKNFLKAITSDLGVETAIDQNIIMDRSMRYQYTTENVRNPGENLTEIIANRPKTKVWVDQKEHTLTNVIDSLISLKRLPLLVIFDNNSNENSLENLKILSTALDENNITDNVGIYFRLANDSVGRQFNQLIADHQYNYNLKEDTLVAAVQSGKIPKFFLKNAWKPMSVIALDSRMGLRHGKTAVYSNCCDLIIEWADQPSMLEQRLTSTWR